MVLVVVVQVVVKVVVVTLLVVMVVIRAPITPMVPYTTGLAGTNPTPECIRVNSQLAAVVWW